MGNYYIENGLYKIQSKISNKILDASEETMYQNGGKIVQWDDYNSNNQKWYVKNEGNNVVIILSAITGRTLGYNEESKICVWTDDGVDAKRWKIILNPDGGGYYIQNVRTGKVIDVANSAMESGDYISAFQMHNGLNQRWLFNKTELTPTTNASDGVNTIENGYYVIDRNAMALDIYDGSFDDNVLLDAYQYNGQNNQLFYFEKLGDNNYKIIAVHSQKALTIQDSGSIVQARWNNAVNQKWKVTKEGNVYYLQSVKNSLIVEVLNNGTVKGTQPIYSNEQQLTFTKTRKIFSILKPAKIENGLYTIQSNCCDKMLDVAGTFNFTKGSPIIIYSEHGGINQKWFVKNQWDGTVKIVSLLTNKVLDLNESTGKYGQYTDHIGLNQKFNVITLENGTVCLENVSSGNAVDLPSTQEETQIADYPKHYQSNQQWKFALTDYGNYPNPIEGEVNNLQNGYYTIGHQDKVIDINNASYEDEAEALPYWNGNKNNQLFYFEKLEDGNYKIIAAHSKKALTLLDNGSIHQTRWHGGIEQKWKVIKDATGNYYIETVQDRRVITFNSDSVQGKFFQNLTTSKLQLTRFSNTFNKVGVAVVEDGMYEIKSNATGKNIDLEGGKNFNNDAKIIQYDPHNKNNQKWVIKNHEDGSAYIISIVTNKAIHRSSAGLYVQHDDVGNNNQKYTFIDGGNGKFYIRNWTSRNVMDVPNGNTDNGVQIIDYPLQYTVNQQWQFLLTNWGEEAVDPPPTETRWDRFVNIALAEQGNYGGAKYQSYFGMPGQPWCAMFVSWCANQAGVTDVVYPKTAAVATFRNSYAKRGKYKYRDTGYRPKKGDLITFDWTGAEIRNDHIGIVVSSDGNRVYTIEGNTSNTVAKRSYLLSDKHIVGYCVNN